MRAPEFSYLAGVRLSGGGAAIWCDAARARAICFLSRADAAFSRSRPDRLIASEKTIALRRALGAPVSDALVPRFGRPFAIGRARLELVPSGTLPGAAQLLVELSGWRGLYAGSPSPEALGGAEPLQIRACDELVVDAPEEGGVADGLEDALRVAAVLAPGDLRALFALMARMDAAKLSLAAPFARVAGLRAGRRVPGARKVVAGRRDASDEVLALGLGPTVDELVEFARDTGARRVLVRLPGRDARRVAGANALAEKLAKLRVEVGVLGPPEQLSLQLSRKR